MKFLSIIFCIVGSAVFINAQPAKGSFGIGGTLMYSNSNSNIMDSRTEMDGQSTTIKINLGPRICYFASEHFMLGLSAGYIKNEETQEYSIPSKISNSSIVDLYYINPFLRMYHFPDEYWGIFMDLSLLFGSGNEEFKEYYIASRNNVIGKVKSDITQIIFLLSPGFEVHLGRILIEASIGILHFSNTTSEIIEPKLSGITPKKKDTELGAGLDFNNLNFGITVLL